MGQNDSKTANSGAAVVVSKDPADIKDISKEITDSEDDINEHLYRIVLTCKGEHRIPKGTEVTCTISDPDERHLTVTALNKHYYNSLIMKSATECEAKIKNDNKRKVDLLMLTVTKKEEGWWTSKKK